MRRRQFIGLVGGMAAWPLTARAQQTDKSHRIGYLALLPGEDATLLKPFSQRLQELGYRKGQNMMLEYRSAEGRPEQLAQLAAELAQRPDAQHAGVGDAVLDGAPDRLDQ